jgi:hypothetical protein
MKELTIGELKTILEKAGYSGLDLKLTPGSQSENNDLVSFTMSFCLESKEEKADIKPVKNPYYKENLQAVENVLNPENYSTDLIEEVCPDFSIHSRAIRNFKAKRRHYEDVARNEKYTRDAIFAREYLCKIYGDLEIALDFLQKSFPLLDDLERVIEKARECEVNYSRLSDVLDKEKVKKLAYLKQTFAWEIKKCIQGRS